MTTKKPIIEIKGLGKRYDIMHQRGGYIALRDVIAHTLRHPFSFVKTKAKRVIGVEKKEEFWALKDISFDVMPGEVIGIIGKNGSGKSTLLKILTGITPPTEGEATMRGRVSSLLEVGTGFHPELTGRENVFLNGAILGMTRKEIARNFDEIVAFSGVEKFLDTPVKHYSSGMQVRLAFSVAAHMEPDILIVDEVLAVGDAEFQKKCMGKMEEVTQKDGRTILFVSHNMAAIQSLCKKTILLEKGKVKMFGKTEEVINQYLEKDTNEAIIVTKPNPHKNSEAHIQKISFSDGDSYSSNIPIHKQIIIEIDFEVLRSIRGATIGATFSSNGIVLLNSYASDLSGKFVDYEPGMYKTRILVPPFTFNIGNYSVDLSIQIPGITFIERVQNINFKVIDGANPKTAIMKDNTLGSMGTLLQYTTDSVA